MITMSKKITFPLDLNNQEADKLAVLSTTKNSTVQWQDHEAEGQLTIDVGQTVDELIVVATMAGTPPDQIELHLHNDLLTIRGQRSSPLPENAEYFYEECYWGKFSRTIVLPCDVRYELTQAQYKYGVLTIRLPKKDADEEIKIMVVEE